MNQIKDSADIPESALVLNSVIGERCLLGSNSKFCYSQLGDLSYIGDNTKVFSSEIGKYCSISWNVTIGPGKHQFHRMSSHAMLYAKRFQMIGNQVYNQYSGEVKIGNDVWIGCNVTIMRDVTIGHGAVIGAGAIISKDVPPYAIMVGVNKFQKWRFEEDIRKRLLEIKWWEYPIENVKSCIDLISQEPTLDNLEDLEVRLKSI